MAEELTLISALARLPRGPGRGFRFVARDRSEVFYGYEELQQEAQRRAAFFGAAGLAKGDRVALIVPEPADFVLTFLGALFAGVVPVPIYPRASFKNIDGYVDVLSHIVGSSGSKMVLCMENNREIVERIVDHETKPVSKDGIQDVVGFFDGETPAFEAPEIVADDLCFLQFTSGSTSKPKGVMVTHGNLVANASAFLGPHGLDRRDGDIGISWLPLFHDMGLIGFVLGTLVCDIPVVLLPTETFARSPGLWLETISKYKGTITYAPNFAYELVTKRVKAKQLENLDLSTLRVAGSGAEPIRAKTLKAFAEKFSAVGFDEKAFLPSYGMAESTLAITFHQHGTALKVDRVDADAMKDGVAKPATDETEVVLEIVSCGEGFPGHDVQVWNDAGEALGERQVGQVVAQGPSVTKGYFENPEATEEAFGGGWLRTGDLGYFADGDLYICGRVKDLIIIRGANHYPQDIEWSVGEIDGVRRGNVFAFSVDKGDGEQLVIVAEANRADAPALRQAIARRVQSEFALTPSHVGIVPVGTLPKTSSGKAQRRKAKAMFEAGQMPEHA